MIEQHYGALIESMDTEIASRLETARTPADFLRTETAAQAIHQAGNSL
jgi:hypothetical protein